MTDIKPWVKYESTDNKYGRFVFEPLYRGMGVTLGNALRRILLSSLGGFAVTSIKIEGCKHEFSTVENVKEDVIEIISNLKKIILFRESKENYTFDINLKGKSVVTAKDLLKNTDFVISNPDQHILTCSENANIDITLTIEYGVGYKLAESSETEKSIETILIDANFTPVDRVNHKVSKVRVGKSLDYDSLELDVFVNGSISPEFAVKQAVDNLIQTLSAFNNLNVNPMLDLESTEDSVQSQAKELEISIDDLDFSARTVNALKRAKITTLKQLTETKWCELEEIKNFGAKCKEEVQEKVEQYGVVMQP